MYNCNYKIKLFVISLLLIIITYAVSSYTLSLLFLLISYRKLKLYINDHKHNIVNIKSEII